MTTDHETPEQKLRELESRLHVFEGLVHVLDDPHASIDIVLAGAEPSDAVDALRERFGLSEFRHWQRWTCSSADLSKTSQSWIRSDVDEMQSERARLIET